MRKTSAILLLCLLSLALCGYQLLFQLQRMEARHFMKEAIRSGSFRNEVLHFRFTSQEAAMIEWEEADEFRLNGHMYDVLDSNRAEGKLTIRCLSDEKEEALINHYKNIPQQENPASGKLPLVKLITTPFIVHQEPSLVKEAEAAKELAFYRNRFLPHLHQPVSTPPPQPV